MNAGGPLSGIRVLELSVAGTGPYACAVLADQGAEVIKIERPGSGDIARWVGTTVKDISAFFQMANRRKRSIAIDLTNPTSREIVHALAGNTDVFVQNFRPGVAEKLGIGYADLRAVNHDLVYVSISGFGPEGPYAGRSAYDSVIQAYAGVAAVEGDADTGEPRFVRQIVADKITALFAAQAITAALFARDRGAGGQHVELAMLDAVAAFLWVDAAGPQVLPDAAPRATAGLGGNRPLRFRDGWGVVSPAGDADFVGMCKALGVDGYDDPRVATVPQRQKNREVVAELMTRCHLAANAMTVGEGLARMEAQRVPCGVVLTPQQLVDDPHVQATGLLVEAEHPTAGRVCQPRPVAQFSATSSGPPGFAPSLGQHTDQILTEIGLGERIATLRAEGVIG